MKSGVRLRASISPHVRRGVATLVASIGCSAFAQTATTTETAPPASQEVVVIDPFTVSSSRTEGYRAEKTVSGTLIATDVMTMPASIQVITQAMLEDMGTRRVEESIRFVSGVGLSKRNESSDGGTRSENYVIRGFATSQVLRNGVRMQSITNSANIERVEILKGPSSIFFGAADPGGVVNVITKRPMNERSGAVKLALGSDSYRYAELDYNQPLVDQKLLFRFMGSRLEADNWRRFNRDEQTFLNGVLLWNATPTTRVTLDVQHRSQDGLQERFGDVFLTTDAPAPHPQRLLTGAALARARELGSLTPTDTYEEETNFYSVNVVQRVGDNVVISAVYGDTDSNRMQLTTTARNRIAVNDNYSYFDRPTIGSMGAVNRTLNINALLTYDLLGASNKLVVGWDRSELNQKELLFAYANNSPFTTKRFLFDPITPATYSVIKYPTLAEIGQPGGPVAVINNPFNKTIWQQGAYVTNQTSLMEERLNLLAGVRWSDLRAQGKTTWTPQVGGSFAVTPGLSVYGLYSESFRPNGRSSTIDPNAEFFPPENGVGKEIGVKMSLLEDRLTGTVALFRVDKTNVRRIDSGAVVQGRNGATLTDGERSEGVEVDLVWTPTRQLTVVASYAHTDARIVSDVINPATAPDLNSDGVPDTIGMPLPGTSPNAYSLWTKYEFSQERLKGLALNVGYQRREGPIPLDASFARKLVTQDTYDRIDVAVSYAANVFKHRVRFQLNVDNIEDNFYADRYLGYADPRTYRFTASTSF
jgi:iron complex outermembrane recepter protein